MNPTTNKPDSQFARRGSIQREEAARRELAMKNWKDAALRPDFQWEKPKAIEVSEPCEARQIGGQ